MNFLVIRRKSSYDYKKVPTLNGDWDNQKKNNSQDVILLYDGAAILWASPCQSVSNLESLDAGVKFTDTIAPGPFGVKLFVEQRDFWPEIHGIINAKTLGGETIDENSITPTAGGLRTLMHDWQKHRSAAPQGTDTSVAWSAACLVEPDKKLIELNTILRDKGCKKDDVIPGLLIEAEA